ncbi:MAG TPA: uracil-DNA glycosylase [Pseudorhodoplanes sp.]|jgi:DNA polymerase|nr:uracil-DNA glycosylase [Pseudorhodoplanes sp.]
MIPGQSRAARDILTFYVENGVDAVIGEAPIDRLAGHAPVPPAAEEAGAASAVSRAGESGAGARPAPPTLILSRRTESDPQPLPGAEEAVMAARAAAKTARSLEELRSILETFEGCGLRATAKRLVFADGNPRARVMFVGEAPGKEEDLEGLPFVGPSGQLLNLMLASIGLDRTRAYIANIIPWRPPGNRDPSTHETQICLPFIRRQIELVDPEVLVCLGKPSTAALLGVVDGIRRTRGRWMTYHTGRREIRAMATFHPAYLLRSPLEKRLAWRDMLAIKKALSASPQGGGSGPDEPTG